MCWGWNGNTSGSHAELALSLRIIVTCLYRYLWLSAVYTPKWDTTPKSQACFKNEISGFGLVLRGTPVQTAMRSSTRHEGAPLGFGNRALISSHRMLLWSRRTERN
jgi:hypothetical protein